MAPRFEGIFVPNITPFRDGAIDVTALRRTVRYLIDNGADGIVPTGTTGESPTLSDAEKQQVWETCVAEAAGQVPVIAGTGTFDTRHTIELTARARAAGVDAVLVVAPYYSRPSQAGLLEHFRAVAGSTDLPVLVYNIPGRTGVNVTAATMVQLAEIDNIVGVKESAGDINQLMDIIANTDDFSVLSGEDHLIFTSDCLGGHGAIAASAHLSTQAFRQMHDLARSGRIEQARRIHYSLLPMIRLVFSEPNPAPLKTAYEQLGLCSSETRLPLMPASAQLAALMAEHVKEMPAPEDVGSLHVPAVGSALALTSADGLDEQAMLEITADMVRDLLRGQYPDLAGRLVLPPVPDAVGAVWDDAGHGPRPTR